MNLAVVMHASNQGDPRYLTVARLIDQLGLARYTYGQGIWGGFGDKLLTVRRAARELTQFTHLLHVDAYDVIVLGTEEQIFTRFLELDHPLVFNAEANCWPDVNLSSSYPTTTSPWPYLNSGCYMGERETILKMLDLLDLQSKLDDQRVITRYYLDHPGSIKIDHGCILFQSLMGSMHLLDVSYGSIYNRHTGTRPVIAHHHGGGNINSGVVAQIWQN